MSSERDATASEEDRVNRWWKDPPAKRGRGRPFRHYGSAVERHRAAQAAHAEKRRRQRAFDAEQREAWRGDRADYMRRYRARHPHYVEADNRRRASQRKGADTLVPAKLGGLNLSPSTLRALTGRSVDYASPQMQRLMVEQPELAAQVLARVYLGVALMAKGGVFGRMVAGSIVRTLPGIEDPARRRGRESISDAEWRRKLSPIIPLETEGVPAGRCTGCDGTSFANDTGRGERFCLGCGAVVPGGPRMVAGRRSSAHGR